MSNNIGIGDYVAEALNGVVNGITDFFNETLKTITGEAPEPYPDKYLDRIKKFKSVLDRGLIDEKLYNYLICSDFLLCPASTKYHGNYEGGLFDHCYAFFRALEKLTNWYGLEWQEGTLIGNIAFGHDVCKLDSYVSTEDGKYKHNENSCLHGHGEKSVILLQQVLVLTEEEIYCILYHMGAYETNNWNAYDKAIRKYGNVLFTHTADMIASKIEGV
jgi:23S rRNA maturation-related 3'-5' exoribonuclease YhaM